MPFEFFNPHTNRIGCQLGGTFGEVKVAPGEYVPTPEQERAGIKAELFEPHVAASFLHKTPGNVRRRLRQQLLDEEAAAIRKNQAAQVAASNSSSGDAGAAGVADAPQSSAPVGEATSESEGDGAAGGGAPAAPATAPVSPAPRVPVPPTGGPRRPDDQLGGTLQKAANDLQKVADRSCSSAGKREGKQLR